jgi:hypothetical protein
MELIVAPPDEFHIVLTFSTAGRDPVLPIGSSGDKLKFNQLNLLLPYITLPATIAAASAGS